MANFNTGMLEEILPAKLWSVAKEGLSVAAATMAANEYKGWFDRSGLPFFREYTDHSFEHSLDVFRTGIELVAQEAFPVFSATDIGVLLLASVAHDAGMHLTEDMFFALTARTNDRIVCPDFDGITWPTLWDEFLNEAKRFSEKKLKAIFGDATPIAAPAKEARYLTTRDRMLIGEFLRRHHPRLAHEIALGAVYSAEGKKLDILKAASYPYPDIVGVVARSHGMPLRAVLDYVDQKYHLRDYHGIHIVYLMVLLRIADFLQLQSARAPIILHKLHRIKSPFSLNEWRVHQSISVITPASPDPEAIDIKAHPADVESYLRLKGWLKDLQLELDTSWAVLGEVYGRYVKEQLADLKISIRRIRSNLDDHVAFSRAVEYVADRIRYTVDEPELLKLLLSPLYGDDPLFGLRELTQNSADSVREMNFLSQGGLRVLGEKCLSDCDIQITIDVPNSKFRIVDCGSGMDLDILQNYFLKAGASFRNSEVWKTRFQDSEGKSKVARAGRFGVGALAPFLIGDKVSVYTRHYSDSSGFGFAFDALIDDEALNLRRERGNIGTIIEVETSHARVARLASYLLERAGLQSFYYLPTDLTIEVQIKRQEGDDIFIKLPKENTSGWIEMPGTRYEGAWRKKYVGGYEEFNAIPDEFISPRPETSREEREGYIFCNNLLVGDIASPDDFSLHRLSSARDFDDGIFGIRAPTIVIQDNGGFLPLDLARKGFMARDAELHEALKRSAVVESVAASFLSDGKCAAEICFEEWEQGELLFNRNWHSYVFLKDGYVLFDFGILDMLAVDRVACIHCIGLENASFLDQLTRAGIPVVARSDPFQTSNKRELVDHIRDGRSHWPSWYRRNPGLPDRSDWAGYHAMEYELAASCMNLGKVPNYMREILANGDTVVAGGIKYLLFGDGSASAEWDLLKEWCALMAKSKIGTIDKRALTMWKQIRGSAKIETVASQVWKESFDPLVLPYERVSRLARLRDGSEVAKFIKRYRTI